MRLNFGWRGERELTLGLGAARRASMPQTALCASARHIDITIGSRPRTAKLPSPAG